VLFHLFCAWTSNSGNGVASAAAFLWYPSKRFMGSSRHRLWNTSRFLLLYLVCEDNLVLNGSQRWTIYSIKAIFAAVALWCCSVLLSFIALKSLAHATGNDLRAEQHLSVIDLRCPLSGFGFSRMATNVKPCADGLNHNAPGSTRSKPSIGNVVQAHCWRANVSRRSFWKVCTCGVVGHRRQVLSTQRHLEMVMLSAPHFFISTVWKDERKVIFALTAKWLRYRYCELFNGTLRSRSESKR